VKSKTIIVRMIIEVLIFLIAFGAIDSLTSPSENTATAVLDAVNKKQLEPSCLVEVRSAIRSASHMKTAWPGIQVAALLLLCSDGWALWQSRRKTKAHDNAA
jgi:hypothetical protein